MHSKSSVPGGGRPISGHHGSSRGGARPPNSPPLHPGGRIESSADEKALGKLPLIKHRMDDKLVYQSDKPHRSTAFDRVPSTGPPRHILEEPAVEGSGKHGRSGGARSRLDVPEDPRLKTRPPEPPEPAPLIKKSKDKMADKVSARKMFIYFLNI